jgi:DNA helicase MCM8
MEQQQISIAKAGVVASLPARCCIIAAANPKKGKYNMSRSVAENLNIASPLLSRFDLCFILRDEADQDQDKLVSGNIMNHYRNNEGRPGVDKNNLHSSSTGAAGTSVVANENWVNTNQNSIKERLTWVAATQKPLPADMVKDYISYAREYCKPKLTQEAASVLKAFFMSLR